MKAVSIPLLLGLSLFSKFLAVSHFSQTLVYSPAWLVGTLAWMLLCLSPTLLFRSSIQGAFAVLVSLTISLLFVGDLMYYRYFVDFPSIAQLNQVGQLGEVGGTVFTLLRWSDLIFFLDLPVYVYLVRKAWPILGGKLRVLSSVGLGILGVLGLFFADSLKTPMQRDVEERKFKNYALGREFGLPAFHLQDLKQFLTSSLQAQSPPEDLSPFLRVSQEAVESIEKATRFRGLAKDANVLVILLESWQSFALNLEVDGQAVMPYLSKYKEQCLYFRNVYDQTNQASSADGEFVLANSLHPAASGTTSFTYQNNTFQALPSYLAQAGYSTSYYGYYDGGFWNARVMNQSYGMEELFFAPFGPAPHPQERVGWGLADYPLLKRVETELQTQEKPFYAVVHASMGHHPFEELSPEQNGLRLNPTVEGTTLGNYLQMCRFRDRNLELFLEEFEKTDLAKSTVVIFTGDHATSMSEEELAPLFQGSTLPPKFAWAQRQTTPLLIHLPSGLHEEFDAPVGQLDFAPTLLHLLGLSVDRPVFLGQNMFVKSKPVYFRKAAFARQGQVLVSVLDELAYDLEKGEPLPFLEHKALAQGAIDEWRLSDAILQFDLIAQLRERWGGTSK